MKVEHLVVDTNAFVKNLPLHELGENISTTREVVAEIRDSATRKRVQVLPYELIYKEPFPEYIQLVTKLSKATGDYSSLSAVDIQLIALAYQLAKEKLGPDASTSQLKTEIDAESLKKTTVLGRQPNELIDDSIEKDSIVEETTTEQNQNTEEVSQEESEGGSGGSSEGSEDDSEETVDSEQEDSDEEGWITPSNYKQKIKEMNASDGTLMEPDEKTPVACLTNDFAMQNLMLHVGIKVLSSNGMLIKQLRTYILRCYTCFSTTSKMEKLFCPKCGHKTLKRVSVTVNPDGTQVIHLSKRVNLTGRGKKYPLPMPKGGKHSNNPILFEDQPIPQQRPSKQAMQRNNPLHVEFITSSAPFVTKDVYSRAAMLGINHAGKNYWEKKNPNEAKKTTSRRKKNRA